jgi:hypothetical protein
MMIHIKVHIKHLAPLGEHPTNKWKVNIKLGLCAYNVPFEMPYMRHNILQQSKSFQQ